MNRNTLLDGKKNIKNMQSIDRSTFNPHNSVSKSQLAEKNAANIDKICSKIVQTVSRVSAIKSITHMNVKIPGSKIFFEIIAIFLQVLDQNFEQKDLNVDVIIDIFKMLNYTGNLSKNIFQPIGAPHTWVSCLGMLEWLAQLATFCFQYHKSKQDEVFQEDINTIILYSFKPQNEERIKYYLQHEIQNLNQETSNIRFSIQTKELALKNLHATQKDIHLLDKQTEKQNQILFRTKQQAIQIDQQCKELILKRQKLKQKIDQQKIIKQTKQKQINNLKNEINHQQLSVSEVEAIKSEIKEIKNKIISLKNKHQIDLDQIEKKQNFVGQIFCKRSEVLNLAHTFIESINSELALYNIDLNIPTYSLKQFMQFVKQKEYPADAKQCDNFLKITQIDLFIERQSRLVQLIKAQISKEKQEFLDCEQEFKRIERQRSQKDHHKKELQRKIEDLKLKSSHQQLQLKNKKMLLQQKQDKLNQLTISQEENKAKLKEIIKHNQNISNQKEQLQHFITTYIHSCESTIKKLSQIVDNHKNTIKNLIRRHRQQLQIANKSIKNL